MISRVSRYNRYRSVALLAIFAGCAELLLGFARSLPSVAPSVFLLSVAFSAGNAIAIREMTLRWRNSWAWMLLMGVAAGVLQEWLAVGASWTAGAVLYHATIGAVLPVLLVYRVFPESRQAHWLGARELCVAATMFVSVLLYAGKDRVLPAPLSADSAATIAVGVLGVGLFGTFSYSARRPRTVAAVQASAAAAGAATPIGLAGASTAAPFDCSLPVTGVESPLWWRAFEIVASAAALLVAAPILLVLAIIIRRGTSGPALYWAPRVGMNRKPFQFVKLRTMYTDGRRRFPDLYAYQFRTEELPKVHFKVPNDPRVTPQGLWLRKFSLDELPNFWHVLRGDMALVGPRPEIVEMLPYYSGEMLIKFSVRPGITGLAQIMGRGDLSFLEHVRMDVEYVKRKSVALDLKILLLTVYKAITQEGAK